MDRISMIRDFTLAKGPSGFEDEVLEVARRYAPEGVEIREDRMRNMYFRFPETDADKPVVMLDAHSDEVGFMVQAVRPNGTLKFVPLGGWVNSNIPAHKVWVRSRSGRWIPIPRRNCSGCGRIMIPATLLTCWSSAGIRRPS